MENQIPSDHPLPLEIHQCIQAALREDIGEGDVTTISIVPGEAFMSGQIKSKQAGVVAGLDVARSTFEELDQSVAFAAEVEEGARIERSQILANVTGPARALLMGERTALNFLGRMSGIATLTRLFVDAVAGSGAIILDTRKTAPCLRQIDKLAVRRGGGENHRMGLYDMILIKDNHIDFAGSLSEAISRARKTSLSLEIEIEARTLEDVHMALQLGIKRIMLDNMSLEEMSEAVRITAGKAKLEASGNVSLENVREIAETGVDYISVGTLTHSAKTLDIHFEWIRSNPIP